MDGPASLAPLPLGRGLAASRVRPSGNGGEGEEGRGRCRMYRISLPQPHYCSRLMSAAQMDEGRTRTRGRRDGMEPRANETRRRRETLLEKKVPLPLAQYARKASRRFSINKSCGKKTKAYMSTRGLEHVAKEKPSPFALEGGGPGACSTRTVVHRKRERAGVKELFLISRSRLAADMTV